MKVKFLLNDLNEVNLPDFMIVGAAKSGTSSLYNYLKEHPQIFMPWYKETWFFHLIDNPNKSILSRVPFLPTNIYTYLGLYADAKKEQICGEATPSYLYYYDLTIPNIKKYHPKWEELKIIIILREPIDKVLSHYKFVQNLNIDPDKLPLKEALKKEDERKRENKLLPGVFYVDNTLYYKQVKAYLDNFPNVKIFLYEELKNNPSSVIKEMYDYVGVDNSFIPNTLGKKFNKSNVKLIPKNNFSHQTLNIISNFSFLAPTVFKNKLKSIFYKEETIDQETIEFLKKAFKEDVKQLQTIIDKDISHWISKYE